MKQIGPKNDHSKCANSVKILILADLAAVLKFAELLFLVLFFFKLIFSNIWFDLVNGHAQEEKSFQILA